MSSNRGHRAGQCAPEVPRTRIRARGDLQELHRRSGGSLIIHRIPAPRPCNSLIRRRYVGGVGNRCRWADRFAMPEQQQFREQAFPAESGTLPHRPWTPMSLVNGRGPQAERCGRDGAKRKSVRKSCHSAGDSARSALQGAAAAASGSSCELANPAQVRQIASQTGVLFSAG